MDSLHMHGVEATMQDVPAPEAQDEETTDPSPEFGKADPFFVLVNVASGSGGQEREAILQEHFRKAGVVPHFVPIDHPDQLKRLLGEAAARAKQANGVLVVAGGDGTINSALPFLLENDIPLGILPGGTFNYVAREFGIPLDLKDAVESLVTGEIVEVAVGQVNGRPFLVNASLGLYPRLLEDRERAKRKYGRNRALALVASVVSLIRRRARTFELEVQRGMQHEGHVGAPHQLEIATLFIGNNALQLRRVGIDSVGASDGLTAVALRVPSPLRLFELGVRAAFGSLGESKDILTFSFEKLNAKERGSRSKGVKVALDGEVCRIAGPLSFERTSQKLRLIAPSGANAPSEH